MVRDEFFNVRVRSSVGFLLQMFSFWDVAKTCCNGEEISSRTKNCDRCDFTLASVLIGGELFKEIWIDRSFRNDAYTELRSIF